MRKRIKVWLRGRERMKLCNLDRGCGGEGGGVRLGGGYVCGERDSWDMEVGLERPAVKTPDREFQYCSK